MHIENLNCGQAPSSKNKDIFFEISGILTGVNTPLLLIIKIRFESPYFKVTTNWCRYLFWRRPVLFSSVLSCMKFLGFSLGLNFTVDLYGYRSYHLSYSNNTKW
jgi:hypothetical protein